MSVPAQQPRRTPCALALLGFAPGEEEERRGIPFCGPTSQPLLPALRAAGIDPADCWIGNLFEEVPPGGDVSQWLREPDRVAAALERLAADLRAVDPTVIVPMGGEALWALTGQDAISKAAGAPGLATRVLAGRKILPTYHPAFVFRQWKYFLTFISHLEKAAALAAQGPELVVPWMELTLEPDLLTVQRWVYGNPNISLKLLDRRDKPFEPLMTADLLSVDIETGWGQITCIGFAPDAEHAICIPFVDLRQASRCYWRTADEELEVWRMVKQVLESPVPKLMQNGTYDAYWLLAKAGIRVNGYCEDTRLMQHAHLPEAEKSLGFLAATYTQLPAHKHWSQGMREEKRDA